MMFLTGFEFNLFGLWPHPSQGPFTWFLCLQFEHRHFSDGGASDVII